MIDLDAELEIQITPVIGAGVFYHSRLNRFSIGVILPFLIVAITFIKPLNK